VALTAYGADFDVPAILEREYDLAEERCLRNGWHRQLAKLPIERAWLAANRALLESERLCSRSGGRPSCRDGG
jgi:hypothetical protein